MLRDTIRNAAKSIIGKSCILRKIIAKEYKTGHYVKAAAMMIYLLPVKTALSKAVTPLKRCEIVSSPEYYNSVWKLLHISKAEGYELIRLGRDYDGGYIMLDDFDSEEKIAYSFGISRDVSWDKDMASRGYNVFMYDHTIDSLPEENERFHWFKLGISDGSTNDSRLKTLEELIAQNHHEDKRDMILKMDVEGAEWGFIENVKPETLNQFSQILFEFHGMNKPNLSARIPNVLRKLNQTHKLIHLHGQNHGYYVSIGGKIFCNQIEVSYVRKDKYTFTEDYSVNLPIGIDMPADDYIPEIELGLWNQEFTSNNDCVSVITVNS